MSTVLWLLLGLVLGFAWMTGYLRCDRSEGGLVNDIKARRRGNYYLLVTWLVGMPVNLWHLAHGFAWWRLILLVVGGWCVIRLIRSIRAAGRALDSPYLYLAALRHEFGGKP